jgi:polyisoprenoid-binding protein YceI
MATWIARVAGAKWVAVAAPASATRLGCAGLRRWAAFVALAVICGVTCAAAEPTSWEIDSEHSGVYFVVRHLGIINVHGSFNKMAGMVHLDEQDIGKSDVNATIDVGSIYTGVEARDKHLLTPDFFDYAKFPSMSFQSIKITQSGNGTAKMTGNLTIHGVTKEVTFDVTGMSAPITALKATRRGISATTTINRNDFGVSFDTTAGNLVNIDLEIDLIKK